MTGPYDKNPFGWKKLRKTPWTRRRGTTPTERAAAERKKRAEGFRLFEGVVYLNATRFSKTYVVRQWFREAREMEDWMRRELRSRGAANALMFEVTADGSRVEIGGVMNPNREETP